MKFFHKYIFLLLCFIFKGYTVASQTIVQNGIIGESCINNFDSKYYSINFPNTDPNLATFSYDYYAINWSISNGIKTATSQYYLNSIGINWNQSGGNVSVTIDYYQMQPSGYYDEYGYSINQGVIVNTEYSSLNVYPTPAAFPESNVISTFFPRAIYNYNQIPNDLIEVTSIPFAYGLCTPHIYQWEKSETLNGTFSPIDGANNATYSFTSPLQATSFFRRKVYGTNGIVNYSNVVKVEVVSAFWEDKNYVREHTILRPGVIDWKVIDQLPVGSDNKQQTTTYLDGSSRTLEKVSKEVATPSSANSLWGDIVQFTQYDDLGRQPQIYLPYATTNNIGSFKTNPISEQASYYTTQYNDAYGFTSLTFDNSPLNRVTKTNEPGASWANSSGNKMDYDLNEAIEEVHIWTIGYSANDFPQEQGIYPDNSLLKRISTDEANNKTIEFYNNAGQLILKKVQVINTPSIKHNGWICTYNVYDDFGLLRYIIQPEAVNYLEINGWTFSTQNGSTVLDQWCFRYDYDEKARNVLKKAPGADALKMLYDSRDRVVFMQDGNQRVKSTPEWTANLYDELDRPIITALYKTTKSTSQLQADIAAAVSINTVTLNQPGDAIVNLVVDTRDVSIPRYAATRTIEFVSVGTTSFESASGDEFIAEIDPVAASPTLTVSVATLGNPISSSDLNNSNVCTVLKYQFYDNYSFPDAKPFDNSFINTTAYANNGTTIVPIAKTARTLSFPTGSKVRVLNTNTFLTTTAYYDEDGQPIQSLEDNIKNGVDITTNQYHYDGRLMSSYNVHTAVGTGMVKFGTLTKNNYDKIGRIINIEKQFGTNGRKTIASYTYDDMGRLKNKTLDPDYINTTTGHHYLESLDYSYNIHNNITGINKDYALKGTSYNKWDKYFGMALGFDNTEGVFSGTKLNGQVAGTAWVTQGDDAQRKYDFTYDNAGRLSNAVFNEKKATTDTWSHATMDFSVSGRNGLIEYDLNGNIKFMSQKGVVIGSNSPITVDDLAYTYGNYSNKLLKVTDANTAVTNGQLGDFKGTANATDYVYDNNGNLVIDLNKNTKDLAAVAGANGIKYNYLDKPEEIRIVGKGTIKIVYDADGSKLQKLYTPDGSTTTKVTSYVSQFVYEQTATSSAPLLGGGGTLQYISFEEGRIRPIQAVAQNNGLDALAVTGNMVLPNGSAGVYDYYIRDYQANVRMILTEETHISSSTATMEDADANRKTYEESVFGQTGGANEVAVTRFPVANMPGNVGSPRVWTNTDVGQQVSRLGNLAAGKIGPNSLLKVMAGDEITATSLYYYKQPISNSGSGKAALTNAVVNALTQTLSSGTSAVTNALHGQASNITAPLTGNTTLGNVVLPNDGATDLVPKAYLTVLFFDERFSFLGTESVSDRVKQAGDNNDELRLLGIKAPKNGYAYVYLSNESDEHVYFDQFKVQHTRGRIIEENHYYAYGLKIAGISSHKLAHANEGNTHNKYLYNDKELWDEGDLNWYDYGFRNYDPQIARFPQLDPLTWDYPELTNYQYASCDPIANIDLDGLEGTSIIGDIPEMSTQLLAPVTVVSKLVNYNNAWRLATVFSCRSAVLLRAFVANHETVQQLQEVTVFTKVNPLLKSFYANQASEPVSSGESVSATKEVSEDVKEANAVKVRNGRIENGLDPETGQPTAMTRLFASKRWQNFNDAVTFGIEGASLLTGVGEAYESYKLYNAAKTVGGRLGNAATRSQIDNIATTLESRGYTITGGGGRAAEEFLKPLGGGRRGGSYLDITATHPNYPTLRINTVDVLKDGVTPTARELRNAIRIRSQIAKGEHLLLIPKI